MISNQKYLSSILTILATVLFSLSMSSPAHASDKTVILPVQPALDAAEAREKLDGSVRFYFGNTPHGAVSQSLGNFVSNKKGNAFGNSDSTTCNHVLLSALITFQEKAKSLGGNAVINLHSYYKKNEVSYDDQFECHVGFLVSGVALKGDVVKLK